MENQASMLLLIISIIFTNPVQLRQLRQDEFFLVSLLQSNQE